MMLASLSWSAFVLLLLLRTVSCRYEFSFTREAYNASIPENSPSKTYVVPEEKMGFFIPHQDLDVRFRISKGDPSKFFKAESFFLGDFCFLFVRIRTGNSNVLNREKMDFYRLEIRARIRLTGNSGAEYEAHTLVLVRVLDVNDLYPLFHTTEMRVRVPENASLHSDVCQLLASDADQGINGEVYYRLSELTEQFAVHPTSGALSLTRPLDFSEKSFHEVTVVAEDRGMKHGVQRSHGFSSAQVFVEVVPVNLHDPVMKVMHLKELVENSNADIYGIVKVHDEDSGDNGKVKSVDIIGGNTRGYFRVAASKTPDEFLIEVTKYLDRESFPWGYNLTLRAVDAGVPPRSSTTNVTVNLMDTNDHAPLFDREGYATRVPEWAPPCTPVIRLSATDADSGKNAEIAFGIVAGNELNHFAIDPRSGVVSTLEWLDYEAVPLYVLTVAAWDQGNSGTRKKGTSKVTVEVVDGNDNSPEFESPEEEVSIGENEHPDAFVYRARATDRDTKENGYISYSLSNLNKVPFEINRFDGTVRTTEVLDYETMRRHWVLRIRASDWGAPYRRQSEMTLHVRVRDSNDNRPQFEKINCRGYVSRDAEIGSGILTLSAVDLDEKSIVTYRMVSGNEDGCFDLDVNLGVVRVACHLFKVESAERELNVTATDGQHFADVMPVRITLVRDRRRGQVVAGPAAFECTDTGIMKRLQDAISVSRTNNAAKDSFPPPGRFSENLHDPKFPDSLPRSVDVSESAPVGIGLLTLRAADRDLGFNGKVVYAICSGNVGSAFGIDLETGSISVSKELDRERVGSYSLSVVAHDLGTPPRSASTSLAVGVTDVNDNAPQFDRSFYSTTIGEDAPVHSLILQLSAHDPDEGNRGKVRFSLSTRTGDFVLDPEDGSLRTARTLDRETRPRYELYVTACDEDRNASMCSHASVAVAISDVNDNAPAFPSESYSIRLREDFPVGAVVLIPGATDADEGPSGRIRYWLSSGSGKFGVDKETGIVRLLSRLDFQEQSFFNLTVGAIDQGSPPLRSTASVLIRLVDVNKNFHRPKFPSFALNASVLENMPVGTEVVRIKAVDEDEPGPDSDVTYYLKYGDGLGHFSVDNTGVIRTLRILDRESSSRYWLSVFARDSGLVPLSSRMDIYVEVLDVNDNVPQTPEPIYVASVKENSPNNTEVYKVEAYDRDASDILTYRIVSGDPEGFFRIDSISGLISTTGKRIDREQREEFSLAVEISDNGVPVLTSVTVVIVKMEDDNDNSPQFLRNYSAVLLPSISAAELLLPQYQLSAAAAASCSDDLTNSDWESFDPTDVVGYALFRVAATDRDVGSNGRLRYSIRTGRHGGTFEIHPHSGMIHTRRPLEPLQEFPLEVRVSDHGDPPRFSTIRGCLTVSNVSVLPASPVSVGSSPVIHVSENQAPGYVLPYRDDSQDAVFFSIVDGNIGQKFDIGSDNGILILTDRLDREQVSSYNLTVMATNGFYSYYTQVRVLVDDVNDHRPEFLQPAYEVDILENIMLDSSVVTVSARDLDGDSRLRYSLHSALHPKSLEFFRINPESGMVTVLQTLDREDIHYHSLIARVEDSGSPSSKENYVKIVINVKDQNDNAPRFLEPSLHCKIQETLEVGSSVIQVLAFDYDKGKNAEITYSIVAGNVGNTFQIDPIFGTIQIAKELNRKTIPEYLLTVRATDGGTIRRSSTIHVTVTVILSDETSPGFLRDAYSCDISENARIGLNVCKIDTIGTSSVFFRIVDGNLGGAFGVNPSSGVIYVQSVLDHERTSSYNLTLQATSLALKRSSAVVYIRVLDENDNSPEFTNRSYYGKISEAAPVGSFVFSYSGTPLVISAEDKDSGSNALLHYSIIGNFPQHFFSIDASTGSLRSVAGLDYEINKSFSFSVQVSDLGHPSLSCVTPASVFIDIVDVNDSPPYFTQALYNATLLIPTLKDVVVTRLQAEDNDSFPNSELRYSLIRGNSESKFAVDPVSGVVRVRRPDGLKPFYDMTVRVSDGQHTASVPLHIHVKHSRSSSLSFSEDRYYATVVENSTQVVKLIVLQLLGTAVNQHVQFSILNPSPLFQIGNTSGAIMTTGLPFDREEQDSYVILVEVKKKKELSRSSFFLQAQGEYESAEHVIVHTSVHVTVLDVNDNAPVFLNQPYYALIPIDSKIGQVVFQVMETKKFPFDTSFHLQRQVTAMDADEGDNGLVQYHLIKGSDEFFEIDGLTGEITLINALVEEKHHFELTVEAYDRGAVPVSDVATVTIKVISKAMPIFERQFYKAVVSENIEPNSPVLSVYAESPKKQNLIYTLTSGNEYEEFDVDFNTVPEADRSQCVIFVADYLDFELKTLHELTLRATDSSTGVFSEASVSVQVQDVNDNAPSFTQSSFTLAVSEADDTRSHVFQFFASDRDSGINRKLSYRLTTGSEYTSQLLRLDPADGALYLKESPDYERQKQHRFMVHAVDSGIPQLSTSVSVVLDVVDVNDNSPRFERASYVCEVSEEILRDQLMAVVRALDPDDSDLDRLVYAIVGAGGNHSFHVDRKTGVIRATRLLSTSEERLPPLNVSVSDGVFVSYATLLFLRQPVNLHRPTFPGPVVEVEVREDAPVGSLLATIAANDEDEGIFGQIRYFLQSDRAKQVFSLDSRTGELRSRRELDRESQSDYELPVVATDGGGHAGSVLVRVTVTDVNDNAPEFPVVEYSISFVASDRDAGRAAEISYRLIEGAGASGVSSVWEIREKTGMLYAKMDLRNMANEVFQFFIRASDHGTPSLHSDVPVSIFVTGAADVPPRFQKSFHVVYVKESTAVGLPVIRAEAQAEVPVSYRLLSIRERDVFRVDDGGNVRLARNLDFEKQALHSLVVEARTQTTPPLVATAEVSIVVLDEDDSHPSFECDPYEVALVENAPAGTLLVKVVAHYEDNRRTPNLSYSFGPGSGSLSNFFVVDSFSGIITTLAPVDRERNATLSFLVIAADETMQAMPSATATVLVTVVDENDNPTAFQKDAYEASGTSEALPPSKRIPFPVSEDAAVGATVVKLEVVDRDETVPPSLRYYVVSGDRRGQFKMEESSGALVVNRALDREEVDRYVLSVIVVDGKFQSETTVQVTVDDVNDNPPVCLKDRYLQTLKESTAPGSFVVSVGAADADLGDNAKLSFSISGDNAHHFSMEENSGVLVVRTGLDRESVPRYELVARVRNEGGRLPGWECISTIELTIADVNDNAPVFSKSLYGVTVPEDLEVGNLITKVHAVDKDLGINRQVHYAIADPSGHFSIDRKTGIVTLARSLDREKQPLHNVTVLAIDMGSPQLTGIASVVVMVSDVNDNPPEFASKFYFASLSEDAEVGTDVIRLLATSKDSGINAEITYSIVGGNEHKKFNIDPKTGVIRLVAPVDYERAKEYFLTVEAKDGGEPSLTNQASVNVSLIDRNDNAPSFRQAVYSASILESSPPGTQVAQVFAVDPDSGLNGKVSYSIANATVFDHFVIHGFSGIVSVASQLDREMVSRYQLEIEATDQGIPPLSSTVFVNIEIDDVNDCQPMFSESNSTVYLPEDSEVGAVVLQFHVSDADADPNAGPFLFDVMDNELEKVPFYVDAEGRLRTSGTFNRSGTSSYIVRIRVFDRGTPPLFSDNWVTVYVSSGTSSPPMLSSAQVIEASKYPPVVNPLRVTVVSFFDGFPGGLIGKVAAEDRDPHDKLQFSLSPAAEDSEHFSFPFFYIDKDTGVLKVLSLLDEGKYSLNVSVFDGKFTSHGEVSIEVVVASEEALSSAVVVHLSDITPLQFFEDFRKSFQRAICGVLRAQQKDFFLLSVQSTAPPAVAMTAEAVAGRAKRSIGANGTSEGTAVLFAVRQDNSTFYPLHILRGHLQSSRPALEAKLGVYALRVEDTMCIPDPCMHGRCVDSVRPLKRPPLPLCSRNRCHSMPGYLHVPICRCQPGYAGDACDLMVHECAQNPCAPPQLCIPNRSSRGYSCRCPDGADSCWNDTASCRSGSCYQPHHPLSFSGRSFTQFSLLTSVDRYLSLSMKIRTSYPSGCLVYASGNVEYAVLEINGGTVQYRFDCGSGEGLVRIAGVRVDDSQWHELRVERTGNYARLLLDSVHTGEGMSHGPNDVLSLEPEDMYLGAEVRGRADGSDDVRLGFVGCLDDVRLDNFVLPHHVNGLSSVARLKRSSGVEASCPADLLKPPGVCGARPCLNGGSCLENSGATGGFRCSCRARFSGPRCEIDSDPCASSPCLHDGRCIPVANDFRCKCLPRLSGKRCQHGLYCNPNPCLHNGVCEEGVRGPICKCRGYVGDVCNIDVNECLEDPCRNFGTCVNIPGSFRCLCHPNSSGVFCAELTTSSNSVFDLVNITYQHLYIVCALIAFILTAILVYHIFRRYLAQKASRNFPVDPLNYNNEVNPKKQHNVIINAVYATAACAPANESSINSACAPVECIRNCDSAAAELNRFASEDARISPVDQSFYISMTSNLLNRAARKQQFYENKREMDPLLLKEDAHCRSSAAAYMKKSINKDEDYSDLHESRSRCLRRNISPVNGQAPRDSEAAAATPAKLPERKKGTGSEVADKGVRQQQQLAKYDEGDKQLSDNSEELVPFLERCLSDCKSGGGGHNASFVEGEEEEGDEDEEDSCARDDASEADLICPIDDLDTDSEDSCTRPLNKFTQPRPQAHSGPRVLQTRL